MKKTLVVLAAVALLAIGGAAYAQMWGPGNGPGYGMMGYGQGYGMMGYGPGNGTGYGMMGYGPGYGQNLDSKAFEETADLRKEIHSKRFDYMEAVRTGDTEKAAALDKELDELTTKLGEKIGGTKYSGGYGRGYCPGPNGWQ